MLLCAVCSTLNQDEDQVCGTCNNGLEPGGLDTGSTDIQRGQDINGRAVQVSSRQGQYAAYTELKRSIEGSGLLAKQPVYYSYKILTTLLMLAFGIWVLVVVENLWLQLVNAAVMAFVFGQIGLIGHDVGHQTIFRSTRRNVVTGLVVCLLIGMVRSWWVDKHNRHHSSPNVLSLDPDTNIPVLAFTEEQALKKRGLYRLTVSWQAYLFFPMLCLQSYGLRLAGVQYLLHHRSQGIELLLIAGHLLVYFWLLLYFLSTWHAVMFIAIHQSLFGVYLGSIFAPNHKGMPVLDEDSPLDYVGRQIITSRNIRSHPLIDFWYGGLNYQIEHHLFPTMSRNKLREAQKHVRDFCRGRNIPYYEVSMLRSQCEIVQDLNRVSKSLRQAKG